MSLLAETVVEEYFNYHGYFTIRGVKKGHDEIDLLAIKVSNKKKIECLHIEVQVQSSHKPVNYISHFTPELIERLKIKSKTSARLRNEEVLRMCVKSFVEKKFDNPKKKKVRDVLFPKQNWKFLFVHGRVRDEKELKFLHEFSIYTKDIRDLIHDLSSTYLKRHGTSSIGRDIINLFRLFYENEIKSELQKLN